MKKRTRMLFTLSAVLLVGTFSCTSSSSSSGGSSSGGGSSGGETPSTSVTTYTVTIYYANGSVYKTDTVNEGSTYSEPDDSFVGNENMIRGWYLDSSLRTAASFPLTVTSNISLYPDVITNEQYFLEAREKTINSNYAYTDNLHIQVKETLLGLATFNGYRTGEIAARPNDSFSYLAHYESSGSLLIDGEQYIMHKDGVRSNITLNEDGELTNYSTSSTSEADDNSVYSKAIFEYDDDDIRALTKVSTNKYQIETTANASSVISSTLNVLGNSYVQTLVSGLPNTDSAFTMYVTYNNGYISTYTYEFDVSVGYVNCTLTYSLNFTGYNTSALVEPELDGLYLSSSQVNNATSTLQTDLTNYKNQTVSEYKYDLVVELENSEVTYSADISGTATRKIENETVYFNNYIETTTKGYSNVEDYERNRVNLSDGSVYSCYETGALLWKTQYYNDSTNRGDVDNYFLLIGSDLLSSTYLSAGEYLEKKTTYSFVFNESGVNYMFNLFNTHVYLNEESNNVKVMGTYDLTTLNISETQLQLVYSSSALSSIKVTMSGYIDTTFDQKVEDAKFDITYTITVQSISDYDIPDTTSDIDIT